MQVTGSIRKYILVAFIVIILSSLIVAKILANKQNEQFMHEDYLYEQTLQLFNEKKFKEAAKYSKQLLEKQPYSEIANYLGGLIASSTGENEQATILFKKALDINPHKVEDPIFMIQFGQILYDSGRYEDAKKVLTRCQEMNWSPEDYPTYQEEVAELLDLVNKNS